ncbi:MAG TPA: FAD-dependent oxidoreductase [Jatrophihabitans sp.]|nr:FAD-dependent oxidoreductase [Jatrophihabitans sp.]
MVASNNVIVVGAGVIGLSTAICLAEAGASVRVRASAPPAESTSAVAGAIIAGPVTIEPVEEAARWNRISLDEFTALADRPGTGVRLARGRMVLASGAGIPDWARALAGFAPCTPAEHAGYPVAFWLDSPIVDMPRYLDYLAGRFAAAGGELEIRPVTALAELAGEAPVVVNCTGLGAGRLTGDEQVKPVRGQHVIVRNPGLTEFFYEQGPGPMITNYLPHGERLVLGGTINRGDAGMVPDAEQRDEILRRCAEVEPRLAGTEVLGVEVGLRPGRPRIRLAEEQLDGLRVIHNYGHGGVGVGMSWGCAREVAGLVLGAAVSGPA